MQSVTHLGETRAWREARCDPGLGLVSHSVTQRVSLPPHRCPDGASSAPAACARASSSSLALNVPGMNEGWP